jgi:hypothetical protein
LALGVGEDEAVEVEQGEVIDMIRQQGAAVQGFSFVAKEDLARFNRLIVEQLV